MTKRLHAHTKIFFPNPYVVRVTYGEGLVVNDDLFQRDWTALMRKTYKLVTSTWGHSTLEYEQTRVRVKNETTPPVWLSPQHVAPKQVWTPSISSILDSEYEYFLRGYVCFQDELDALQFRLALSATAVQVKMWPSGRYFRIHEVLSR